MLLRQSPHVVGRRWGQRLELLRVRPLLGSCHQGADIILSLTPHASRSSTPAAIGGSTLMLLLQCQCTLLCRCSLLCSLQRHCRTPPGLCSGRSGLLGFGAMAGDRLPSTLHSSYDPLDLLLRPRLQGEASVSEPNT